MNFLLIMQIGRSRREPAASEALESLLHTLEPVINENFFPKPSPVSAAAFHGGTPPPLDLLITFIRTTLVILPSLEALE